MLKWLYLKLIGGCDHKWMNVSDETVMYSYADTYGLRTKKTTFQRYHQQCKVCGKMQIFNAK